MQTRDALLKKQALQKIQDLLVVHQAWNNNCLKEILTDLDDILVTQKISLNWHNQSPQREMDIEFINARIRQKLQNHLQTENQFINQKYIFDAIHACLLILGRYWPHNDNYDDEGNIICPHMLVPINNGNRLLMAGRQYDTTSLKWFIDHENDRLSETTKRDRQYLFYMAKGQPGVGPLLEPGTSNRMKGLAKGLVSGVSLSRNVLRVYLLIIAMCLLLSASGLIVYGSAAYAAVKTVMDLVAYASMITPLCLTSACAGLGYISGKIKDFELADIPVQDPNPLATSALADIEEAVPVQVEGANQEFKSGPGDSPDPSLASTDQALLSEKPDAIQQLNPSELEGSSTEVKAASDESKIQPGFSPASIHQVILLKNPADNHVNPQSEGQLALNQASAITAALPQAVSNPNPAGRMQWLDKYYPAHKLNETKLADAEVQKKSPSQGSA